MAVIIQLRRGNESIWTASNPTLAEGEAGVELDTGKFKVGDGTTDWNSLAYSSGDNGVDGATWHSGAGVPDGALGADGDYYLNTTNGDVYEKDTTWSVIANLTGDITSPLTNDIDFAGYKVIKPLLENYAETVGVNTAATGAVDIDLADGNVHEVTLTGDVSALSFSNPAASGQASKFTLLMHQGGTNDSGTASAGGNDTLTDSTKSWDDTEWEDWYVRITGGTGAGQIRQITSNTATVLTVTAVWDTNPSTDSTYEIYKAYSVEWPASVQWHNASAPALANAAGTYMLTFFTTTGGTTWYGAETGSFSI